MRIDIAQSWQATTVIGYGIFALAMTAILWRKRKGGSAASKSKTFREFIKNWREWGYRALMFVVLFVAFLIASALGANTVAGQLGAAPVLPLFALYSIATAQESEPRVASINVVVFLGPLVAMSFVIWYASAVYETSFSIGLSLLLLGWVACFACIFALALGFNLLDRRSARP